MTAARRRAGATPGPPAVGSGDDRTAVLHVVKGLDEGGAEHLLVLAARHRDRSRFTYRVAHLLADHIALRGALTAEDVSTTCLHATPWWDPRWLLRLRRLLRTEPVDIVHAHSPLVAGGLRLVVLSLPRRERPRIVVTLHNVWASHHPAVRALDRATHRLDDHRVAVSDAARRSLPPRLGRDVTTLVHGIDVGPLRDRTDRAAARRELGVDDREVLVGTVANPSPLKGYPDLLDAAARVVGQCDRARFVAIGEGVSRPELETRRDAAGLGAQVRFLGHRPDAARLTAGFDVFCLASHHEGLPLALMEALVLGIPVVVTDVGGIPELVTHDREGLLVPPHRPDLLAAALLAEITDADQRARHGEAARARGSGLDAVRAVRAVEDLYDALCPR